MRCQRQQTPLEIVPFHQWELPDDSIWASFHRIATGYLLRFPEMADFMVSAEGLSVICHPVPGISEDTSQHLYLNQVLPLALSLQRKLVFHGSAVEVDGVAIAFVGATGRGKSTLAASFACNGFRFLTDDGLVLEPCDAGFLTRPSHPSIRLWNDSENALLTPGVEKAFPLRYTEKSRFMAGTDIAFCNEARPLRTVYFLSDDGAEGVVMQPMAAAESLVEWVKHSFLLDFEKRDLLSSHFELLAQLANNQEHYILDFPRRFEDLDNIRRAIVEYIYK